MPTPLVLKNGAISQELAGEVGVYPYLWIQTGVLKAGSAGLNRLQILSGVISTYLASAGGPVLWDVDGPSIWDGGAANWGTGWDVLTEAVWDGGAATWS